MNINHSQVIADAILELQKQNRNISAQDLSSNIILVLLAQYNEMNLSQLIEFLNCPQAYLTHFIKRLIKNKLVKMRQDSEDLRYRYYSLSENGQKTVKKLDLHYDSVLIRQEQNLSKQEIVQLANFFSMMSDAAGISAQRKRPNEHIIRPQQRRLAALLGITGRTLFGEKVLPSTFHILRLLNSHNGLLTIKDLSEELSLRSSQISLALKIFWKNNCIKYIENPFDERSRLIELSDKGSCYFKEIEKIIYKRIEGYLKNFSSKEKLDFAKLFQSFVISDPKVYQLSNYKYPEYRSSMLEYCYLNSMLSSVPERIASKHDSLYGLEFENELVCYAQVENENKHINLLAWRTNLPLRMVKDLLQFVIKKTAAKPKLRGKLLNLFEKSLT
jgi:DNA-binding MarR family transcriptional regulator